MEALALFHAYVEAFNRRDAEALAAVFAPDLISVHPGEPEVDVSAAAPFVTRMLGLWPRGLHYRILRATGRTMRHTIPYPSLRGKPKINSTSGHLERIESERRLGAGEFGVNETGRNRVRARHAPRLQNSFALEESE